MGNIAMFGGAFNPIHKGHVHLALSMLKQYALDKVLLIPSGTPPHKSAPDLAAGEHRLAMCRLAAQAHPALQADGVELIRQGKSYTADTVKELKRRYPHDRLFLIVGSDMLFTFDQWFRYEEILQNAVLLAGARNDDEYEKLCRKADALGQAVPGGDVRVSDIRVMPMSSTQVRQTLYAGEDASAFLEPEVLQYIQENSLYQPEKTRG